MCVQNRDISFPAAILYHLIVLDVTGGREVLVHACFTPEPCSTPRSALIGQQHPSLGTPIRRRIDQIQLGEVIVDRARGWKWNARERHGYLELLSVLQVSAVS